MNEKLSVVPVEQITRLIRVVREQKVIFDADLAQLYGVATKRLNEQVKRNAERFPEDFVFKLSKEEYTALRSQSATSNSGRGGRRYLPYAFTEQRVDEHDESIRSLVAAIRQLMALPQPEERSAIGFGAGEDKA